MSVFFHSGGNLGLQVSACASPIAVCECSLTGSLDVCRQQGAATGPSDPWLDSAAGCGSG